MAYKSCPDCGERVYRLGCVNCNEEAYIAEQQALDTEAQADKEARERYESERAEWAGYPLTWGDEG
jgi:hypothetical protein